MKEWKHSMDGIEWGIDTMSLTSVLPLPSPPLPLNAIFVGAAHQTKWFECAGIKSSSLVCSN